MDTHTDEPCDICGDVGVIETICTCYVCKISRQHPYCMKTLCTDLPLFWCCEDCENSSETKSGLNEDLPKSASVHKNTNNSGSVIKHSSNPGRSHRYREKWIDKGKTKYIPCGEAIKLSSGSKKFNSSLKISPRNGPGMLKSTPTICERTSSRPKVISPKTTSPRVKENPAFGVLGRSKSPTPYGKVDPVAQPPVAQSSTELKDTAQPQPDVQINLVAQQSVAQSLTVLKENKAVRHSKDAASQIRQPLDGVKSPKKVKSPSISAKSPPPTISAKSAPPTISGGNVCENVEQRSSNAEERSREVSVPEIVTDYQTLPSRHAYWKGSFKLPNGLKHLELNNGFNAHPPSKLRLRIYELLKKMPEELDFELVPRFNVLTDIFKDSCPVKDDIGLYFFPGNYKSSENYISLLEFMWAEKLVLRSNLNGVELFVLTSRVLQPDFQQWHGTYYLWGIFRGVKMANDKENSRIVHPSSDDQVGHSNVEEDMDVDPMNGPDLRWPAPSAKQPQSKVPPPPPPGFENSPRLIGVFPVPPPPGFENYPRPFIKTQVPFTKKK